MESVINSHTSDLARMIGNDLGFFSNRFIELGFITRDAANDIVTQRVGNGEKGSQLLNCVVTNSRISHDKKEWFDKFVSVFSSQAPYAHLARSMTDEFLTSSRSNEDLSLDDKTATKKTRRRLSDDEESSSSSIEITSPSSDSEEQSQKKKKKKKERSRPKYRARSSKRSRSRDSDSSASSSEPRKRKYSRSHRNRGLSPVLQKYKVYLQAYYKARDLAVADKYLPTLKAKYTNLAMVIREPCSQEEKNEFTKATFHGGIDQILKKKSPITITDLLIPIEDGKPVRFVLVEGPPGIGKSTFAWEVCKKWDELQILRDYHAVVLVRLRERWVLKATSLPELFRYPADPKVSKVVAKELNKTQGVTLLLVLDGFDEISHSFHEGSVLKQILRRELLPECTIVLTTRPSAKSTLQINFQPQTDKHIEIIGFTEEQRREYITNLKEFRNRPQYREEFLKYMFKVPHIESMMYIPLNCAIIAKVYSESQEEPKAAIPRTRTQLYRALTNSLLMRYMAGKVNTKGSDPIPRKGTLPEGLPQEELARFIELARFAFESYHSAEERKITFFEEDVPNGLEHFGFMNQSTEMYASRGEEQTYTFLHLSLQEYLAAWHLAKRCSSEHQIAYHSLALHKMMEIENEEQSEGRATRAFYSTELKNFVSKFEPLTSSLVEPAIFLAGITGLRGPSGNNPWEAYLSTTSINVFTSSVLLHSLYESQNHEICRHYFTTNNGKFHLWEVRVGGSFQTAYDSYALSYCINYCSENIRLTVFISNGDTSLVEMFSKGLHDHCGSKTLKIKNLCIVLDVGESNLGFDWLASTSEWFLTELEVVTLDCYRGIITSISALSDLLESFSSLKSVDVRVTLDENCSSGEWIDELKSLPKLNIFTISSLHSPTNPNSICWLLRNGFRELNLEFELTRSVYDVGLQSATASYVNSVLKSILVPKQITKLSLPYVTRDTMKNARRMLVECGNLIKLELRKTRLGYDGIIYICSALRDNTTLTHLTIYENGEHPMLESIIRHGIFLQSQYLPLPNIATYNSFLLEMNDILRSNTTLKELDILRSGTVVRPPEKHGWRTFTGHGPLHRFNMRRIESLTPHTLRRSYSLSDISHLHRDILWHDGTFERNVASALEQVIEKLDEDATCTWKDVFQQFFKGKKRCKSCSSPSFTASDTDGILQSFAHLDPRLKKCLGISDEQLSTLLEHWYESTCRVICSV